MRLLRRGVFPVCFDLVRGHDYALYASLLEEARYFRIARLEEWLDQKRYVEALKVTRELEICDETDIPMLNSLSSSNTTIDYYPSWTTRQVYICPRGLQVHRGGPGNAVGFAGKAGETQTTGLKRRIGCAWSSSRSH